MKIVDYTFEVTVEAVEVLQSMRQMSGNENGGILLGSEIEEQHYRINRVSEPCMLIDRSSKYGCIRDAKKANEIKLIINAFLIFILFSSFINIILLN